MSASSTLTVWLMLLAALWLAVLSLQARAQAQAPVAERRVALVVGNAEYVRAPLVNPVNDAADLAAALRRLGFEVIERRNRNPDELRRDLVEFQDKLGPGAVGLFYFAGHGVQAGRGGRNYLLPVGVDYRRERDAEVFGLDAGSVLARMEESGASLSVVILDACRDSPLPPEGRTSASRGLGRMEAPSGSLVAFATAPGSTADENPRGRNGLYTQYLLQAIEVPGLRLEDVFQQVRRDVERASNRRQSPEEISKLTSAFYFRPAQGQRPGAGAAAATVASTPAAAVATVSQAAVAAAGPDPEIDVWELAKRRDNVASYEAYLGAYPQGRYAAAARAALAGLRPAAAVVPAPTPAPQVVPSATPSAATVPVSTPGPQVTPPATTPPQTPVATAVRRDGEVFRDCAECPELVVVAPGRFEMGSPASEVGRDADEGPVREVRIGYALAVGRHEVTRREFGRFVAATGYRTEAERDVGAQGCAVWSGTKWEWAAGRHWRSPGFEQGEDHPVVCVSWNDAQAYLRWLNESAPGRGYRLLSEAEWEYVARAGRGSSPYPWGDDAGAREQCAWANGADEVTKARVPGYNFRVANCSDGHAYTAPVGSFRANAFGLHDLHGNAWEWVQDVWHESYAGAPSDGSAWLTGGDQTRRVLRGGSWGIAPQFLRSAYRVRDTPGNRSGNSGFRIARTL